jgi:hypothetical protein
MAATCVANLRQVVNDIRLEKLFLTLTANLILCFEKIHFPQWSITLFGKRIFPMMFYEFRCGYHSVTIDYKRRCLLLTEASCTISLKCLKKVYQDILRHKDQF